VGRRAQGAGRRLIRRAALALALLAAAAGPAAAHAINFAVAFVTVDGDEVSVNLTINGDDIDRAAGLKILDNAIGMVDPQRLRIAEPALRRYIAQRSAISAGGLTCALAPEMPMTADSDGGIGAVMKFACPHGEGLVYRSTAMTDFDTAARQAVMLWRDGRFVEAALLGAGTDSAPLNEPRPWWRTFRDYFELGVEHIFLGWDHLAFLVAVLLWATRLWAVVKIITAFTVAHSITLTLAALDLVAVSPALVEPAIAATIVVVALENFLSRDVDRRWRWTFALGLVHGFGFAGVLEEIGLPEDALPLALGAFNLGVEVGQLGIVAIVLPLLLAVDAQFGRGRRHARPAAFVYACSALLAALGTFWLVERIWL
jgi:hydrogenase/urease accessory protein HupE